METLHDAIQRHYSNPNMAAAFGILLYTEAHPFLRKVLEDEAMCEALDKISGPRWVLFYSRISAGYDRSDATQRHSEKLSKWQAQEAQQHQQQQQHCVQQQARFSDDVFNQTCAAFEIDPDRGLPCLVTVFPTDDRDTSYFARTPLADSDQAGAFESLRSAVVDITDALKLVDVTNLKNAEGLHAAVTLRQQHRTQIGYLSRFLKVVPLIKGLAGAATKL